MRWQLWVDGKSSIQWEARYLETLWPRMKFRGGVFSGEAKMCAKCGPMAGVQDGQGYRFLDLTAVDASLPAGSFSHQLQKILRRERLREERNTNALCGFPQRFVGECRDQNDLRTGRLSAQPFC